MKECFRCKKELSECCFGKDKYNKDGLRSVCKDCMKISNKKSNKKFWDTHKERLKVENREKYKQNREALLEQKKDYHNRNREIILHKKREYVKNNPEKCKESLRQARLNHIDKRKANDKEYYLENREAKLEWQKQYARENREYISSRIKEYNKKNSDKLKQKRIERKPERAKQMRERRKNDPEFKVKSAISSSLSNRLKRFGHKKSRATFEYTGIKTEEYVKRLSVDALWEEYVGGGNRKIHIDHIIPCSLYDHTDSEEIIKCWHPRNLRLLTAHENVVKFNKLDIALVEQYGIHDLLPKDIQIKYRGIKAEE